MILSGTTRTLHWLVAGGLLALLAFGFYLSQVDSGPEKTALVQVHKSFGIILASLLLLRLAWRIREGWPAPAAQMGVAEATLARCVHIVLLIAPLVMVASGVVRSLAYARPVAVFGMPFIPKMLDVKNEGLNAAAALVHDGTALVIIGALVLHVAGALRHHFLLRDPTLVRMLGGGARGATAGARQE